MKELKILAIVVGLSGLLYFGIEPFAHSQMHPHVDAPDYSFKDVAMISGGDAIKGKELVTSNCVACHGIKAVDIPAPMDNATSAASYGVTPPDLSSAGLIYDRNYLAAFIKNPAKAGQVEHKFVDGKTHPMPAYNWMSDEDIASMVAYLESIAPKSLEDKEVFADACQRCHAIKYADMQKGTMDSFSATEYIKPYMGTIPPDLSMMIRSKGAKYLHEFINEPSKHLHGTPMPRVGLTKSAEEQVVAYIDSVGDSKKEQRETFGFYAIIFLVIMSVSATIWKMAIWKEVK
jgi:ubiquinol-cytochrome c reductase cytochrome c1 subunit